MSEPFGGEGTDPATGKPDWLADVDSEQVTTTTLDTRSELLEPDSHSRDHHHLHPEDHHPNILVSDPAKLGTVGLAVLTFYSVSGGPFGTEQTIGAAGNFYTLMGFLIGPFVWSIQEAAMTAELGALFPEASGGVAWVDEAFGEKTAWVTGWLGLVAGVTNNAIYPVMFLDYLSQLLIKESHTNLSNAVRCTSLAAIAVVLSFINYMGLNIVGKVTLVICIIAMSPFVILSIVGAFKVDPSRWGQRPDPNTAAVVQATDADISGGFFPNAVVAGILLRPYLNNLFWNLNSFNSAGTFAGDVTDPGKIMPRALYSATIFIFFGYVIPLLVILGASDAPQTAWVQGYYAVVADDLVGPWLGGWLVFAAGVSNIALYQASLSTETFQLMGMAERGFVPKLFATRSNHGTPTNAILLGTICIIFLSFLKLDQLFELLNFNYGISLLIEFTAFLKLRRARPDLQRPYRVPLSNTMCTVVLLPTFVGIITIMFLASYATMLFFVVCMLIGIVVYMFCRPGALAAACERLGCRKKSTSNIGKGEDDLDPTVVSTRSHAPTIAVIDDAYSEGSSTHLS